MWKFSAPALWWVKIAILYSANGVFSEMDLFFGTINSVQNPSAKHASNKTIQKPMQTHAPLHQIIASHSQATTKHIFETSATTSKVQKPYGNQIFHNATNPKPYQSHCKSMPNLLQIQTQTIPKPLQTIANQRRRRHRWRRRRRRRRRRWRRRRRIFSLTTH